MDTQTLHIGGRIHQVMAEKGKKVSWLAQNLCFSRGNVYKLYQKDNIDVKLLIRISELLEYDFFLELSDLMKN